MSSNDTPTPVPYFLRSGIPAQLEIMNPVASLEEINSANAVRQRYYLPDQAGAYMVDIVRAFRGVFGAKNYVEVGTRDKGNIGWLQTFLAPDAVIVDIDMEQIPQALDNIRSRLRGDARYETIEGDSVAPSTISAVRQALRDQPADAIFLDSSHMHDHIMREIDLYLPLLRPGGLLLIHDAFWEGNDTHKGKAQALQTIDRFIPVFAVYMQEPVRRFFPLSSKLDTWGGVGVVVKP